MQNLQNVKKGSVIFFRDSNDTIVRELVHARLEDLVWTSRVFLSGNQSPVQEVQDLNDLDTFGWQLEELVYEQDGNKICCHDKNFTNLQESPAGFGAPMKSAKKVNVDISVDSCDFVLAFSVLGSFITGEWIPTLILGILALICVSIRRDLK